MEKEDVLRTTRYAIKTGCGKLYVSVSKTNIGVQRLDVQIGKNGHCQHVLLDALGKVATLALENGVEPHELAKQLVGYNCEKPFFSNELQQQFSSCVDCVGYLLKKKD